MIRINGVKVLVTSSPKADLENKLRKKYSLSSKEIETLKILKRSIDARNKKQVFYVYDLALHVQNEKKLLKFQEVSLYQKKEYKIKNNAIKEEKIVIVGAGPAGLFAAYLLALKGVKPIVIERGEDVDSRVETVEHFFLTGDLKRESNVHFGEGGAGTFSDGKLNTLVHDMTGRKQFVLETFVKFGANEEILYDYKPHIGTDVLRIVVKNMREYIKSLGGKFYFNTCLTDFKIEENRVKEIEVNHKSWMSVDRLVLAIGHSARDTFSLLHKKNVKMEPKAFAIGLRVEHLQSKINEMQYGKFASFLPPASYKLTYQAKNGHGVYSFCMCPGGYVVNASSEEGCLVVNGMSNARRESQNANSAIVVTVPKSKDLFGGVEFQRSLEKEAYALGKGDIPVQLLGDYLKKRESVAFKSVIPSMKGKYIFAKLHELLPPEYNEAIREAFQAFDQKMPGFNDEEAILSGIESRTSSPIRIARDDAFQANIFNLYPCGEGAGYAGGIMTSAIDGLKVAEEITKKRE